ncbi:MAG: hypothetical protein CVV27_18690 [Candidatus Melainabacteria bacterium HGW-Melainabacteria-1]|nr:MAG: hypothetical protein CVV27_18690 [Candidatus Melainabacteria bacterium HGW-Melainabacteria-1]
MSILYEDKYLVCDDDAITIKEYFFPFGSKRILYNKIKKVSEQDLGVFSGRYRIWGMDLSPYWYHLDFERPKKRRAIALDTGELIKPTLTPEQHDMVLAVLKEKTRKT